MPKSACIIGQMQSLKVSPPTSDPLTVKNTKFNALFLARFFAVAALVGTMLSLPLVNTMIALSLICWCFTGFKAGTTWAADLKNPAVMGALLLFAWMLLSVLWAQTDYRTSLAGVWKYRKLMWVPLMVFLFADEKWRVWALKSWLAAAVVLMLFSLERTLPVPFGAGHTSFWPAYPLSVYSYITLGFTLLPAITLGLAWLIQAKTKLVKGLGALIAVLTLSYVVFGQIGRTTYITLLVLVMFFIITQLKGYRKWVGMGILVLGATSIFMLSTKVQTRFHEVVVESQAAQSAKTVEENYTSSGLRLNLWRGTIDIFKAHPILGTGVGTWAVEYRKYVARTPGTPPIAATGGNPHQEYLLMASQLGLVGAAIFVFWLGFCLVETRRLERTEKIAAQTLIVAFAVGSCLNSYLYDSASGHFFCLGLGILFAGFQPKKLGGKIEPI